MERKPNIGLVLIASVQIISARPSDLTGPFSGRGRGVRADVVISLITSMSRCHLKSY